MGVKSNAMLTIMYAEERPFVLCSMMQLTVQ